MAIVNKTAVINFETATHSIETSFSLELNNPNIMEEIRHSVLGVHVDKILSWKQQIEHVCRKISKGVNLYVSLHTYQKIS